MKLRFAGSSFVAAVLMVMCTASTLYAQSNTLGWDPSPDPAVSGYVLSYGTQSGVYSQSVDVGNALQYTVNGLDLSLDYYFVVQAYTPTGLISGFSNEAFRPAPVPPGTTVINSLTANTGFPVLAGTSVTWTANAYSVRGPVEYKFVTYSPAGGWALAQDYTSNPNFTWRLGWNDLGPGHILQVWVRSVGSPYAYEAWVGSNAFDVVGTPVQLTADVDFPTPPGNPVHWTATVAGSSSVQLEYKFLLLNMGTGAWSVLQNYSTNNHATWTPSTTGNYLMQVWVRRVGSTAPYDVWGGASGLTVSRTTPQVTVTANQTFPAPTGTTITFTARPKGGTAGPFQYQFVRYSSKTGWSVVQPYSTANTWTWTPAWGEEGRYVVQVWMRNGGSTAPYDAFTGTPLLDVTKAPLLVTVGSQFPAPPGTSITITGQVSDPSATFEYQFFLYDRGTGTWSIARSWGTGNSLTWTPTRPSTYLFQVWARKVGSATQYDVFGSTNYLTISSGPAQVTSITANTALPASAGQTITWTAVGVGGTSSPLQYKFLMLTEGVGWTLMRDWSSQNTVTWTTSNADIGNHLIQVWVRSAGSTATYEGWLGTGYFIIQP